jgi:hypothetical protein
MPDEVISNTRNIFAWKNEGCVIVEKAAYRRDTPKP